MAKNRLSSSVRPRNGGRLAPSSQEALVQALNAQAIPTMRRLYAAQWPAAS